MREAFFFCKKRALLWLRQEIVELNAHALLGSEYCDANRVAEARQALFDLEAALARDEGSAGNLNSVTGNRHAD